MHPPAKRMRLRRECDSQMSCIFANCHGCEECSLLPPNKQRVHTPPALRLTRTDQDEGIGDVVADAAVVKLSEERVDPSLQTRYPLSSHSQEELHAAQTTDVLGDAPRRQALEGSTDSSSSAAIPTCGAQPARVGPIALVSCEHPPYVPHSDALARDMSSSHGAHPANGESVSTATFSTGAAHSAAPDAGSSADGTRAANRGSVFTAASIVSTDHAATLGSIAVVSATCSTVRARTQVGILILRHFPVQSNSSARDSLTSRTSEGAMTTPAQNDASSRTAAITSVQESSISATSMDLTDDNSFTSDGLTMSSVAIDASRVAARTSTQGSSIYATSMDLTDDFTSDSLPAAFAADNAPSRAAAMSTARGSTSAAAVIVTDDNDGAGSSRRAPATMLQWCRRLPPSANSTQEECPSFTRELELEKQYCAQAAALCEEEAAALRGARLKLASLKSKLSASRLRAKRDAEKLQRER
ncbi:MAG: hypothetical protein SGPRY_000009 [Prymnesium sp.]